MSDFGDIQNWSDNRLVDNDDDPNALFEAKNAKKRWRHLVHVEERWKAEEAAKKRVSVSTFSDKRC